MIDFKNKVFTGANNRKSLFDCEIPENAKSLVVFMHGYKGYKDWGAWNLMQNEFVNNQVGFLKFNCSHNGGTIDNPIDFDDLNAFGENRYSYELEDLQIMISEAARLLNQECGLDVPIWLIGHSRGGGVVVLEGSRNKGVEGIISLAGISDIGSRFPTGDELQEWKETGVRSILNGRTQQEMPHYYSFHKDYLENKSLLDIESAANQMKKPFLQIHGDMDLSVSISEGLYLANWTNTQIKIIKGGDHTFGTKQPWNSQQLSDQLQEVVQTCLEFINKQQA